MKVHLHHYSGAVAAGAPSSQKTNFASFLNQNLLFFLSSHFWKLERRVDLRFLVRPFFDGSKQFGKETESVVTFGLKRRNRTGTPENFLKTISRSSPNSNRLCVVQWNRTVVVVAGRLWLLYLFAGLSKFVTCLNLWSWIWKSGTWMFLSIHVVFDFFYWLWWFDLIIWKRKDN